jgi:alkaline phosphatase
MSLEEGSKSFAQFTNDLWGTKQSDESNPTLSQMTEKAIDLLDDSENGFFLMVEGAHIDKHSHNNESENMTEAMTEFDKAIKIALDYAKADGETLVVVTADQRLLSGENVLSKGCIVVKIETDYNKQYEADLTYSSLLELLEDEEFFNKIIEIKSKRNLTF